MSKIKTGIFIISRMNSSRLPEKAKILIKEDSMIEFLFKRLSQNFDKNQIVICTSNSKGKTFYKLLAKKYGVKLFIGSNKNVLKRIVDCMKKFNFRNFVRVTGDNPLTDPVAIKILIKNHCKNKNDYTFTNSIPWGLKAEVFSFKALKKCMKSIIDKNSTEYLTYYFKRKDKFKIQDVKLKKYFNNEQNLSISIDKKSDVKNLKKFFNKNKFSYNIKRKNISYFLKKYTKPIKSIDKIALKTAKYDVRFKSDKHRYLNLSKQKLA